MKTVGIIAEYNPFHNGHLYQLNEAKKATNADYCIIVMSGDFTQRGTPALLDKYARCEMALHAGADLVIELPVCYATASAEFFAKGAVAILDSLHIDALCFGSECGEIAPLQSAAKVLTEESTSFKKYLKDMMRQGQSYPTARCQAFAYCLEQQNEQSYDESLLMSPNNTLGIEYLKAINTRKSTMEAYTIQRRGSGYLDSSLSDTAFCSALAIREHLSKQPDCNGIQQYIPQTSVSILKREVGNGYPLFINDFSSILFYKLLSLKEKGYEDFFDVSRSLSNKIVNNLDFYCSYTNFCNDLLKSRDLTQTRINRCLLHILLNIKNQDLTEFKTHNEVYYARILGFRKESQQLFSILNNEQLPFISKMADADRMLSQPGRRMLNQDIFAAHLYDGIAAQKTGRPVLNEYRRQIVII